MKPTREPYRPPGDEDDPRTAYASQIVTDPDKDEADEEPEDTDTDKGEQDAPPGESPDREPEGRDEIEVDADTILMRQDYSRKMHKLGEERRALQREAEEIAAYREVAKRYENDPEFREAFDAAILAGATKGKGQAEAAAPKELSAALQRIEMLEQRLNARSQDDYADRLKIEAEKLAAELKLTPEQTKQVVIEAVKEDMVGFGQDPSKIGRRLRMVAAEVRFPQAKVAGQRELLDKLKRGSKAASPVGERPAHIEDEREPDVTKMSKQEYRDYLISVASKAAKEAP